MGVMGKQVLVLGLVVLVFFVGGSSSASLTSSPTRVVNGYISNGVSALMKWLWSLKATTKTAISSRPNPMMKFESGYNVETVFDGSKLGIEPHTVEVLPGGELLILDSENSNLYKISASLSLYSRPKLIAGSAEGYSGYVDGKLREARMNHPKGLAVDDRGNIYVADTMNMAIRKISDTGVTTIAGGKWSRGGHQDGASEDAKFSNDFDVVYIGSSCSLLVIDRGNRAIREIQLHFDDCAYQYGSGFPLGIAVLVAAGFFGYMIALLQRRVGTIVSSQNDHAEMTSSNMINQYQKPKRMRPPLIPTEDDIEKHEETFLGSLGKLVVNAGSSIADILGGILPGFRRKPLDYQYLTQHQHQKHTNTWPVQDSFVIRDEDEPPPPTVETRTPTPRKTYAFMSKDAEKMHQWRQGRAFYNGWDGDSHPQNQQHQQQNKQQHHHHQSQSTTPHTYYEQSHEKTKEIMFGAVQAQDGKQKHELKPVNYDDPIYSRYNLRARSHSMSYRSGY